MFADVTPPISGDDTDDWLESIEVDTYSPLPIHRGADRGPWIRRKTGLLEQEVPLRHDMILAPADLLDCRLGLTPSSVQQRAAFTCILCNVVAASARSERTWVFYSRDRNHFAHLRKAPRYLPNWYSYLTVLKAIDALEQAGLLLHKCTNPSPSAKYRSRLKATPHLLASLFGSEFSIVQQQYELVVLRDAGGTPIDYRETGQTDAMRREIAAQNAFLSNFDITVKHSEVVEGLNGFLWVRSRWLDPRKRTYRRIFNCDFSQGGRWYGPWWQNLPSDIRGSLRISGASVVERDFRACHLRLLYAYCGLASPLNAETEDPYDLPGHHRRLIKTTFNVMLNASTWQKARSAIGAGLSKEGFAEPYAAADHLMAAVTARFADFGDVWCTGIGLRLQKIDAEICERVQRRMRQQDVPVLSVHDSFIAPAAAEGVLASVMEEEMQRACTVINTHPMGRRS